MFTVYPYRTAAAIRSNGQLPYRHISRPVRPSRCLFPLKTQRLCPRLVLGVPDGHLDSASSLRIACQPTNTRAARQRPPILSITLQLPYFRLISILRPITTYPYLQRPRRAIPRCWTPNSSLNVLQQTTIANPTRISCFDFDHLSPSNFLSFFRDIAFVIAKQTHYITNRGLVPGIRHTHTAPRRHLMLQVKVCVTQVCHTRRSITHNTDPEYPEKTLSLGDFRP